MAKQQESSLSTSLQALVPFREQQQSTTSGSPGAGFGGGGGKMFHHINILKFNK